jgi:hypothetical protein
VRITLGHCDVRVILLTVLCACTSPTPSAPAPAARAPTTISEALARKLAIDRYRDLFTGTYWRSADGAYHAFPPLDEADLVVEEEDNVLVVTCAPLRGYHMQVRVAKGGEWVELVNVGYAGH